MNVLLRLQIETQERNYIVSTTFENYTLRQTFKSYREALRELSKIARREELRHEFNCNHNPGWDANRHVL